VGDPEAIHLALHRSKRTVSTHGESK
jgi:hypothetical protein